MRLCVSIDLVSKLPFRRRSGGGGAEAARPVRIDSCRYRLYHIPHEHTQRAHVRAPASYFAPTYPNPVIGDMLGYRGSPYEFQYLE